MKAVIQKVKEAEVKAEGRVIGRINRGLLVFLAVHTDDEEKVIDKMADKIMNLRVFEDKDKKMNLSLRDAGGEIMVVSQFTLYGDTRKGNRPSFIKSAKPPKAILFYEKFVKYIRDKGFEPATGKFGAMMEISLVNSGPTTIIINL